MKKDFIGKLQDIRILKLSQISQVQEMYKNDPYMDFGLIKVSFKLSHVGWVEFKVYVVGGIVHLI